MVFSALAGAASEKLSAEVLARGTHWAQDLMYEFPPGENFVLNAGPGAALASAYFRQALSPAAARDYYRELMLRHLRFYPVEVAGNDQVYFGIFDRVIPSVEVLRGRRFVINQGLENHLALNRLLAALAAYRRVRRPDLRLSLYVVTKPGYPEYDKFAEKFSLDRPVVRRDEAFALEMEKLLDEDSSLSSAPLRAYADTELLTLPRLGDHGEGIGALSRSRQELPKEMVMAWDAEALRLPWPSRVRQRCEEILAASFRFFKSIRD